MSQISQSLQRKFAQVLERAVAVINRHPQADMATELRLLSQCVSVDDQRDSYGKGGTITQFEQQLTELFEKQGCVFLPTGTLAQLAAMKCYSESSGRSHIGLHPTSHLLLHEHMAIETLWGLNAIRFGSETEAVSFDDVKSLNPNTTAAIIIELPMREIGGALPEWEQLVKIRQWCDLNNVKLHMDGARIWQVTPYYQRSLAEVASLFDSLYISFYKDLGGIFGAGLLGSYEFVQQARIWSRRAGGNPITQYPEVLAARSGLKVHLERMPNYVNYTRALVDVLRPLNVSILPEQPQASMFHLKIALPPEQLAQKIVQYAENTGVVALPLPREGDEHSCTCEISVGDNALAKSPEFWLQHIKACLAL